MAISSMSLSRSSSRLTMFVMSVLTVHVFSTHLASADDQCYIFPGATLGQEQIATFNGTAEECCSKCSTSDKCAAWTYHKSTTQCFLKDNVKPENPPRPVDKHNNTFSGLRSGNTCNPNAKPVELCPEGYPCPQCGASMCSCEGPQPGKKTNPFACLPPHNTYPFCDLTLSVEERVNDLISRINNTLKPNMLTARGRGGDGMQMQALPELGVPAYYWGTNCLHSLNGGSCVTDSKNQTRCPTNFPSGPSFGATFNRDLITKMANVIGVELRAEFVAGLGHTSIDCWGPVINLNRDPRWGRNGEGGTEDAYLMGELARSWTTGFQAPRPSKIDASRTLLQGIITLKHMAVNSLENTAPFNRHDFDANATYGVDNFVLADYYFRPFKAAIKDGGARGIMCSYNAVLGKPTCLSPLIRNARKQWGFEGYVTSDSDSVQNAYADHMYPQPNPTAAKATALALTQGQCDINSGDTYNNNILNAVANASSTAPYTLTMDDVDRALFNSLKQRFDLGLFDPKDAYDWPTNDSIGSDASAAMSLEASQQSIVLLRNDEGLLPLATGKRVAVIGPHANATKVLVQPYPFSPFCPDNTMDCLTTPIEAISEINGEGNGGWTKSAAGCDLFNLSKDGFAEALALAEQADYVILGLGIETCGMTPSHNVNPAEPPGRCYQEKLTTGYVFPDQYLELEAHDRTTIDLPQIQHELAAAILALGKPTVIYLFNGGAVAIDAEAAFKGKAPIAIIEAFYPGPHGGTALAQGIYGKHNKWGRLPYTIYPKSFADEADMSMHDLRSPPGRTYRYYRNPLYPFGHGLSLTTWALKDTSTDCITKLNTHNATSAPCVASFEITNTGDIDGDIVIMAYFTKSNTTTQLGLLTPLKQLFDFTRVTVASKATTVVDFTVSADVLATYKDNGDLVKQAGVYTLSFEDGGNVRSESQATVSGADVILDPFPSDQP
eukprot:m.121584 g.121584  ORF g.121584 m.121584 type:complete len:950 (-) comp28865_c0_seq1:374-3223(-)